MKSGNASTVKHEGAQDQSLFTGTNEEWKICPMNAEFNTSETLLGGVSDPEAFSACLVGCHEACKGQE